MPIECLIDCNCPSDISCEVEDNELFEKLENDTITQQQKDELIESIITSCECGATLRLEITKTPIDKNTLTAQSTYMRLGWDTPDAFKAYGDDRMSWADDSYGWSLFKIGPFYILTSGFTA
jgi:hypothetical protein